MISILFICISLAYVFLIGAFILGFDKLKTLPIEETDAKTSFSVIIPFRNEAENLAALLNSIEALDYQKDLMEVILVNDASEDASLTILEKFLKETSVQIKVIDNIRKSNSPKKDAINAAMKIAKHQWIVTTDADCILPKYWLHSFDAFIQRNDTQFIIAPVTYHSINTFFKRFQLLDFLSLQGATIGGFGIQQAFLCNGANLAYKKDFFETANGFAGNNDIASGDDIFMLEKAHNLAPEKVHYLKCQEAIVSTKPVDNVSHLISQRVRWASKTTNYKNSFAKIVGLLVLLMNASVICMLLLSFAEALSFQLFLFLFICKCFIDYILLFKTLRFFNQKHHLTAYFFSCFLYPLFSVYIVFVSVFGKYKWKGRVFRK